MLPAYHQGKKEKSLYSMETIISDNNNKLMHVMVSEK